MLISHILNSKGSAVITVAPDDLVVTLLNVLAEHHIGAVVVSHDGTHVDGIVSERDVVRAMAADPDAGTSGGVRPKPISAIMTVDVAVTTPDTHVDDVMALMTEQRVRHVPVVTDGVLLGIVSIGDIVKARLSLLEDEKNALLDYVNRGG